MNPAKLGILTTDFSPRSGGVYEAILGQARALSQAGRTLEVINLTSQTQAPSQTDLTVRAAHSGKDVKRALMQSEARIVHSHGLWIPAVSLGVRSWRKHKERALVISPHGMLDPWALQNGRLKKRLALGLYERRALNAADCLHALNPAEASAMRALGLKQPIAIIPNGVDFPPLPSKPNAPDDPRRTLLFLGRLHPKKGLSETIQAWSLLLSKHPEVRRRWRIVIAGWDDGDHQTTLENLVRKLGLENDISFRGAVYGTQKTTLLAGASAFILASHSEGLPMAVLEAWAHELPVFMSKQANLPEGFTAGGAVETGTSPETIAKALEHHLESDDLLEYGRAGRALVEEKFTWNSVGLRLNAVYAWLLGEQNTRPDWVLT
ncbi:glycosyltransferase [Planktotalea sp.]|uniref:glycosyltransferase n=1 Tax=Planktotalea sp. TaxID=2029877 RepID=UPI003D6A6614